jgi:hypothetical protein
MNVNIEILLVVEDGAMINLLSNASWQFAITIALGIISILISIWLASKRLIQLPTTYETIAWELVDGSDEEIKEILKRRKAQLVMK